MTLPTGLLGASRLVPRLRQVRDRRRAWALRRPSPPRGGEGRRSALARRRSRTCLRRGTRREAPSNPVGSVINQALTIARRSCVRFLSTILGPENDADAMVLAATSPCVFAV